MARSSVYTFGLLNAWPRVMHEDMWRWAQLAGEGRRVQPGCNDWTYIQYERDFIADSLYRACNDAADYLGFYPAPTWVVDELVTIDQLDHWRQQSYMTRWGYVEAFGHRATTLVDADAEVVFSDPDDDGIDERGSVTVTTPVADDELFAFFRVADGAPAVAHDYWQIEPLLVTNNGDGTKTLSGHASLFANPATVWAKEYASPEWTSKFTGDIANTDHYVASVDVYRVYADATSAVQLICDPEIVGSEAQTVNATGWLTDPTLGVFQAWTASGQTEPSASPRRLRISYKAGYPLDRDGRMDARLETAIVRYANVQMPQELPFCDRTLAMWKADRAVPPTLSQVEGDNPPVFGLTGGGLALANVVDSMFLPIKGKRVWNKLRTGG